ncbi:hypothetical protein WJX84_009274, partial [Apatococcus fuscideae]
IGAAAWLRVSSVDILKLYEILHGANLDADLPTLDIKIKQPVTLRQLLDVDPAELARLVAPSLASLHFSSPFSSDPTRAARPQFCGAPLWM